MLGKITIGVLLIVANLAIVFPSQPESNDDLLKADFELQLHRLTNALHPYVNQIQSTWTRRATTTQEDSGGPLTCQLCNSVMPILHAWANMYDRKKIQELVIEGCKVLNLAPKPDICDPIIKAYTDQFLYVIANTTRTNDTNYAAQICGILTPDCNHPTINNITVKLAGNKPAITDRNILSAVGSPTTKIIQFTDLHVDLDYQSGRTTDCGKGMPICCRDWEYGGIAENETLGAGPFGDFRCGLPLNTFKHMANHAKKNYPDARYIFLTGDYIHSAVWLYNEQENGRHHRAVTETLVEIFDNETVKIFPLTGNHEPHLINMYPPKELWGVPGFNLSWLYSTVMQPFVARDPDMLEAAELERFLANGWYTVSPEAGLRLIVLNTNLCSPENFWLAFNPYPVATDQLQWLADELQKAENKSENVLIVGHIEPGNCYPAWSAKFNEIMERFEGIVRGSFFGHSHKAQYRVSMAKGELKPVFASYIAGSALPDHMHPAYSVFHADGERKADSKWDIVRHEINILHLGESNQAGEPRFRKLADSHETLGMENLSPASVLDLGRRLMCNQTLVDTYLTFHTKGNDTLDSRNCNVNNATCMYDILCNVVSSNAADNRGCQDFQKRFRDMKCYSAAADSLISSFGVIAALVLAVLKHSVY